MRANIDRIMADIPPERNNCESKMGALRELRLTADDPRFTSVEMINCESCSRSNPPNRTSCLYCGEPFQAGVVRADIARINFQRPEVWEEGYSLVFAGPSGIGSHVIASAAGLLRVDVDILNKLLAVGIPVPLVYLRSLPDAGLLGSRLSQIGFDCAIVGDDLLQAKVPPTRVRRVRFDDESVAIEDFNTSRVTPLNMDEPALLVTGSLIKTSTEVSGKISKRSLKTTDETLTFSDETVLDIYPANDVYGFRIRSSGFDFSCLGERMKPLAGANMNELCDDLRNRLRSAKFIDAFTGAAPLIEPVWPVDEVRQASNVTRGPLGGIHKNSLTILDNTSQFTKFSRLQRHFI